MTKIISQGSPQITLMATAWADLMSDLVNPAPANDALKDAMRRKPLWTISEAEASTAIDEHPKLGKSRSRQRGGA